WRRQLDPCLRSPGCLIPDPNGELRRTSREIGGGNETYLGRRRQQSRAHSDIGVDLGPGVSPQLILPASFLVCLRLHDCESEFVPIEIRAHLRGESTDVPGRRRVRRRLFGQGAQCSRTCRRKNRGEISDAEIEVAELGGGGQGRTGRDNPFSETSE